MGLDVTATYGRASELCLTARLTAAGNIKATAGKLYWVLISNANGSMRNCVLHDDNDATSDVICTFYNPPNSTKLYSFDPPIPCDTGIRFGSIEHSDVTILGGYV